MLETLAHIALSLLALIAPLGLAWYLIGRRTPRAPTRPASIVDKTTRKIDP